MTVKTLIEKNDNDMREEIQARFDGADHMKDFCKEHGLI